MKTGDTCTEIILVCPQGLLSYFACNKRMSEDRYSLCITIYIYIDKHIHSCMPNVYYMYGYSASYLLQFQSHFSSFFLLYLPLSKIQSA